jgi:hypothetical protein
MVRSAGIALLALSIALLWAARPVAGEVRAWVAPDQVQSLVGMFTSTALILGAILVLV